MTAKKPSGKLIQFNELQLAMLEFIQLSESQKSFVKMVQEAVTHHATTHPLWDMEDFQRFLDEACTSVPRTAASRKRLHEQLSEFMRRKPEPPVGEIVFDSRDVVFDL